MYWEQLGFKEPPFALTPNPAFLFLSTPHQEAFAHLLFAIENRVGFIELSGEVGTGKTTLVRTLLNHLEPDTYRTALIFNPTVSPLGLAREINTEFGISAEGGEIRDLHQALNTFLLEENRCGRTVVLVIDEAQNLSVEVMEQIRLISNLETESDKLIQIVLVGQPELRTLLSRSELRQLDQRITVRYHLKPMGFEDSCDYIRHRVKAAAGGQEPVNFAPGALKKIFRFSGGFPRLINGACDRSLLAAYTAGRREVSSSMATASLADFRREEKGSRRIVKAMAGAVALAAVAALIFLALPRQDAVEAKKPAPVAVVAPFSPELAQRELASVSLQENLPVAVNALLGCWKKPPVKPTTGQAVTLASLLRGSGLTATRITANLESLERLDAPALLHVAVPGGERVVALVGVDRDGLQLVPAVGGKARLSAGELGTLWKGSATVLWKDFHGLAGRPKAAEKADKVKRLQGLLKEAGSYAGPVDGKDGALTTAAVREFQAKEGMTVDGKLTPETLMRLYRQAGGFFPPGIVKDRR
ncbi:AAA family ATPase [Geomonas sp. Red32]|uniref:AAA family ATPase n=1 Tax=Geomonas sp. Red32 TaxID=2912856 RepID=UPI00202CE079|nr:AAA family ATPase [Geomonas sp. Red32]MCM0082397.1 AAA family ATPase [Geomonas sp. Red32]